MTLFDAVLEVFVNQFKLNPALVVPSARFEADLGFDSLAEVELGLELQRRFGVRLTDDEMLELATVSDVVKKMEEKGAKV